jgi:hypothetical protein
VSGVPNRHVASVRLGGEWVPLYAPEPRSTPRPAPLPLPKLEPPNAARFLPKSGTSVPGREVWAEYVRACDAERVPAYRRPTRRAFFRALESLGAVRTATREGILFAR